MATNAYIYVSNEELHRELGVNWVNQVIQEYAEKHEKRLVQHSNAEASQLLDTNNEIRRLKRTKPQELKSII